MKRFTAVPLLLSSLVLTTLTACGDGTDDGTGGGDSGGSDSGGSDSGGGSGASTSGGGSGGGSGASTGDGGTGSGGFLPGGGTAVVDFNDVTVNFDVYSASVVGDLGFITASDSTDSDTVDSLSIRVSEPAVGAFDCTDDAIANLTMQAENADGETTNFSSLSVSSCTITITEWGAVGEPVRGTFSGIVKTFLDEEATLTSGSFDLIRGTD